MDGLNLKGGKSLTNMGLSPATAFNPIYCTDYPVYNLGGFIIEKEPEITSAMRASDVRTEILRTIRVATMKASLWLQCSTLSHVAV